MEEQREEFRPAKSKISIPDMDDKLRRHLNKVCEIKNKKNEQDRERVAASAIRQEWEVGLGKLVIKETFARGSFASVHKGLYDGQEVAVKVLNIPLLPEGKKALERDFHREVSVWFNLDHPNITKCFGGTTARNSPSVITEFLPGGTLMSHLRKEKKLHLKEVLKLAQDVARGLRYLHSKNIVHRDLKTENLLLDKNRIVKIADFGVSRLEDSNLSEMTGYTGSPGYMAPEVMDSKPYDKKCDIYSFGICLWEIYCCKKHYSKYSSSNLSQLATDVVLLVYKNVRPEIPKSCPSSLANVMRRCWDAEPRKRPGMEEVVTMLEEIDNSRHHHGCFWFSK